MTSAISNLFRPLFGSQAKGSQTTNGNSAKASSSANKLSGFVRTALGFSGVSLVKSGVTSLYRLYRPLPPTVVVRLDAVDAIRQTAGRDFATTQAGQAPIADVAVAFERGSSTVDTVLQNGTRDNHMPRDKVALAQRVGLATLQIATGGAMVFKAIKA